MDQNAGPAQMPPRPHWPGYISTSDLNLRLNAWNASAGVTLTLSGLVGCADGAVHPFVYTHIPNTDRSRSQQLYPLEAGVVLCAQVLVTGGAPLGAQCYVRLELVQGLSGGTTALATILSGYVTANSPRTYPNDVVQRSVDGRGTFRSILGTVPAAGAEIVETVPANTRWVLTAFAFQLVTSAAVANRTPILTIDDGANILWETADNAAVAASTTKKYRGGAGIALNTAQANDVDLPLPESLVLAAGARIRTVTGLLQAGDQYAAPVYNVEEWLDV